MAEVTDNKVDLGTSKVRQLDFQVAGHPGVLEVEDGGMIIKPLNQRELQFYEGSRGFSELQSFMPMFYGTLELAETETSDSISSPEPIEKPKYLCVENLVHGFKEPCVIDVKLGSRLWDVDATPEKQERMAKKAERTTSGSLGLCITGMRLYGEPAADRDWCRDLTPTTIMDAFEMYFAAAEKKISTEYRNQIIEQLIEEIMELKTVVEKIETRMYASSLLFIYEASKGQYDSLLNKADVDKPKGDIGNDEGNCSGSGSDGGSDDGALVYMKAIDFAHSHWTPGQGPDDNYLAGVNKLVEILETFLLK
ncbi:hypothetical protein H4217_007169 [Coemansia sp. RSA 1939]|nr:hypothetical protein H4217_007169 [Coemansia sp. RSA 1939]KAJ2594516.1 hypothetical protein EV177_008347 [Coemansia sp. RSA 1804]KAJ2683058.1 hypothetical protein GGH99_004498 [Coemansia sp. RSA 1285]